MLFDGWAPILRLLVAGIVGYVAVVGALRIAGKRSLANMDEFDLVVTVAIGSVLGTLMLDRRVALVEGVLAIALLISLQFLVSWAMSRYGSISRGIQSEPRLLLLRGELLRESMKAARLTEDEVLQAIRRHGVGSVEDLAAVVLETNGDISVIRGGERSLSALRSVPQQRR